MIDRDHALCVRKQAALVGIARSTVYYLPRPASAEDLALMKQIDALHTEFPFAGARMLRRLLAANGSKIGRRHVRTLMQRMGIEALYRRPRTTKPEPGHKVFPYLLRGLEITRPNQVWAMDITYIPMAKGFVYLAVVLDWFSRRVLSWRLSITMEAAFCIEALQEALARHGKPEIVNTDQGSQFTGAAFTGVLAASGVDSIAASLPSGASPRSPAGRTGAAASSTRKRGADRRLREKRSKRSAHCSTSSGRSSARLPSSGQCPPTLGETAARRTGDLARCPAAAHPWQE